MTTAADIVTGAFLNINSFTPGEPLSAQDAQVGLNVLNDLLESLSNDEAYVYTQQETLFQWIAGQFQYSVGNPVGGTFVGTITGGSNLITGISQLPSQVIVGSQLTDTQNAIPQGTSLFPAATTVIAPIGATTLAMSANALVTPAINPAVITYTVPGNIPMARPLRFREGFTRANAAGLDYTFTFTDFDNYKRELLKNVQGPWPYIAAYQQTFPYGTLYVYPAPAANYTAHIFSDLLLTAFASITTPYALPQGYTRSLKKLLALELAPIYGKTPTPELKMQAKEAKDLLKGTNSSPSAVLRFDSALMSQTKDAGWIVNGGF